MKKLLSILGKILAVVLLGAVFVALGTSFSGIYRFRKPAPFHGPDIYNPYQALDTTLGWKRANFHTHTWVEGPWPIPESDFTPAETEAFYRKLGYDIVTFSNHNELTGHPTDSRLQVNVYEHGYNLFKFHKLVFGSPEVIHYDNLLPFLPSHKQFELEYLSRESDFIQLNHPYRVIGSRKSHMEKLSGYQIMELDSGCGTENEYWDQALSAGHYSFGLASDDLHHPDRTDCIGIRCAFLCTPSGRYEDLKQTLLGGCYYAMRVPDYGNGDWEEKIRKNRSLPFVENIGLAGSTAYLKLSAPADSIRVIGQDHRTLSKAVRCDSLAYTFLPEDSYARFTAWFPDGEVIYTHPFARYDAAVAPSPFNPAPQRVNVLLTLLYNLLVLVLMAGIARLIHKICKP